MPKTPDHQTALGQVIHKRRLELELSQEDIALAAGSTQGRISGIEAGENPSFGLVRRMAMALGWSALELVRRVEEHESRG